MKIYKLLDKDSNETKTLSYSPQFNLNSPKTYQYYTTFEYPTNQNSQCLNEQSEFENTITKIQSGNTENIHEGVEMERG